MLSSEYTWVAVGLIVILAIIVRYGLGPILAGLDKRGEKIRSELDEAQKLREEAQHLLAEYKRKQRDALKEAEDIVEHAKAESKRLREQGEKDLAEALERRERLAMEKIAQAEARALGEVRNQAVEVAIATAGRLIADNLDDSRQNALTEQSIKDVTAKLN